MMLQVLDTILSEAVLRTFIYVLGGLAGGVIGAYVIHYLGELLLKIFGFALGGLAALWLITQLCRPWAAF